jgi:hypothetical protein
VNPPEDERVLLQDWYLRCREAQWAQYAAHRQLMRAHYWLGLPLTLLAAFAGTAVFASLSDSGNVMLRIAIATTLVIVAVLGGLQTFLKLADRAAFHHVAATGYARVRRLIEEYLAASKIPELKVLSQVRQLMDDLAEKSPTVPSAIWRRVEKRLQARS